MHETLAAALRDTVRQHGDRPAVVGAQTMSYAQLDAASEDIAAHLRRLGIAPGARVGLFRRKSVETVAWIHGILKAGCAYVPIDWRMGTDRLTALLHDAGLAALSVDPALQSRLVALTRAEAVASLAGAAAHGETLVCAGAASSGDTTDASLAYVLYTSGSTGVPKGVEHTHASALAFVSWAAREFEVSATDRLSCHAPLHFDLTTFDLFVAAAVGACVVLVPEDIVQFPLAVAALIESQRVTVWYSVPFALIQLARRGRLRERNLLLRHVVFAGERFPPLQLRELASIVPAVRLSNLFGPTETNVCTYHHLTAEDLVSDDHCPIGLPCPYATVAVVDEHGDDVPAGGVGELLVGGGSIMRGYHNRPELNERVFVSRNIGGRAISMFRTGDVVTAPGAGPMLFHGRADRQVKVRGFRVELDEVETALAACRGVATAAAWVERGAEGAAEIRAAVAADSSASLAAEEVIAQVKARLPHAAVPTVVIVLPELPRTLNGKIDYHAVAALAEPLDALAIATTIGEYR